MFLMRSSVFYRGLTSVLLLGSCCASAVAGQIDTETFNRLMRGMSESEVLLRAGPPDIDSGAGTRAVETTTVSESDGALVVVSRSSTDVVRKLHYIPDEDEHDPHLTVITISGGVVTELKRSKVFSRKKS